ncbi:MAG: carboxymuconolactone decarboxylase family protein [Anaerolineales bacterium]|nr:carboxymuconolactone decarboxylase family protein [Anaerolineales bacterium]
MNWQPYLDPDYMDLPLQNRYTDLPYNQDMSFIPQPPRIPFFLKLGILLSEKITGKMMLPPRILSWYPKAAVGSGIMEALVAHEDGHMDKRMLKLIRMSASNAVACPFCVDMNSHEYSKYGITDEEAESLRGDFEIIASFSEREKLAIAYTRLISATPLKFHPDVVGKVKAAFTEREFVILVSTAAQVNFWARLIQGLGIPPAGFGE